MSIFGKNENFIKICIIIEAKKLDQNSFTRSAFEIHSNFLFSISIENHKMFDKFKEEKGGEMMEERTEENVNEEESVETSPNNESTIGISELMGKRAKLEEAIDYVGLMIKNLKDKRTMLEKDIEEESVDIKNLKEKLEKVSEYIDEENRGIQQLADKRMKVENEADEVATIINNLRDKLSGIDTIVGEEGNRVRQIKESRDSVRKLEKFRNCLFFTTRWNRWEHFIS